MAEETAAEITTIGKGAFSSSAVIATAKPTMRWSTTRVVLSVKL
jgi:hypothetical protein